MTASAPSARTWIDRVELVDHHCHGVLAHDVDRAAFEDLITESDAPAPAGTTVFDGQLGFAVRRHCAPALGLEPFATPEAYLARRLELGADAVNRRLLSGQGYRALLVETGHRGDAILSPEAMGAVAGAGFAEVVRLERLIEELAGAGIPAHGFRAAFGALLDERLRTAVGVKSIAAYRIGLDFDPARPADAETDAAYAAWAAEARASGRVRLEDAVLIRFAIWEAVARAVPIQFHIGFGDPDVDLHRCDPLLLTELLRRTRRSGASVMLLHCYPFHREAGYLAHCFEHVYCDVGLAVNYTGSQSAQVVAESLELTPFHKALYSSDAWGAPELFHLGALLFRRGLAESLDRWAAADDWPVAEQRRVAELVASGNARRVYRLDEVETAGTRGAGEAPAPAEACETDGDAEDA